MRERDAAQEVLRDADKGSPIYKAVERVLDEHSAWIARPNDAVTRAIALAAGVAWMAREPVDPLLEEIEMRLIAARAENDKLREALAQAQQWEPAARDVLAERRRQVSAEGWDTKHDDHHTDGELAVAASCYANPVFSSYGGGRCPIAWPWNLAWWKPKDRRRDLVRAGALILAEIARLDRACAALAEKEPAK
jgi:hypothetical protein